MEIIQRVRANGGLPVLNWAPGKWFFGRGRVVAETLAACSPQELLIGDTTLRNTLWPVPRLMQRARQSGFRIIAGSDPLPFAGEERLVGSYGFTLTGDFSPEKPATSLLKLLSDSACQIDFIGKRNNPITFAKRQFKIMAGK